MSLLVKIKSTIYNNTSVVSMCIILSVAYFLHVSLLRHSIQPMWLVTGNRRVHIIVLNQTKSIFIDFYIYFIAVYKFTKVYHFTLHLWSHINLHLYMLLSIVLHSHAFLQLIVNYCILLLLCFTFILKLEIMIFEIYFIYHAQIIR